MKSSRTCLWASQLMAMPASLSQWRLMAQSTQVCMGEGFYFLHNVLFHLFDITMFVFMQQCFPFFLQEPYLPRSLLLQLLLLQLHLPEPVQAMASRHLRLRPSAPHPPPLLPLPRVPAQPSRPPAGRPNSGCPSYLLPRPVLHREAQHESTVQWESNKNKKLLHNKYLINPVNLLAVQSWTQSPRILYDNRCPNAQLCILFKIHSYKHRHTQTHTHYKPIQSYIQRNTYTLVNRSVHAKHNQLSQNPLTGVVTTELEKFDFRIFCLFVAIFVVFLILCF